MSFKLCVLCGFARDAFGFCFLKQSTVAMGTVPLYQAAVETVGQGKSVVQMDPDLLFRVIEQQAEEGVDFITVHCGVTRASIERLKRQGRIMDVVSRGGAFHLEWIICNESENPLYAQYDRLLEIAKKYDITLSLGDGMRPGCLADATDRAQIEELIALGELRDRAIDAGVQVMIEGPGHVLIDQVETNIKIRPTSFPQQRGSSENACFSAAEYDIKDGPGAWNGASHRQSQSRRGAKEAI